MAKMRQQTKATKMKLSERVQRRPEEEQVAPEVAKVEQPEVTTQPIKSSTTAAKASVERENNSVAVKLMEASTDTQEDAIKVDKKLLKAVTDLTKTMQFGNKKAEDEKKKGIGGYVRGKIASVKSAFTLEGAAGLAGIGRDDGSLKGAVLGSILERKEKKAKKAEYIAQFGEFTERGRELKQTGGLKAVTAEGEERYKKLTSAEKDIAELESKQKKAKMFNGTLSTEDTAALAAAQERKKEATDYSLVQKPMGGEKKEELLAGVAEGVTTEIAALSPEEKQTLNAADPEYLKGVFEGALGSLTEINEKQLDQLVALVRASTQSEEDKMESKNKDNILTSIQDPDEDKKKKEEGGGFMKSIMDMVGNFKGLFKNIPGMLMGALKGIGGGLLGGAAKLAAPLLGAGKAIVGGATKALPAMAEIGSKVAGVASKALPAVAEVGTKAAGLGTKAMGGLSKFGGLAKGVLGKLGPVAMAGMAAYDAVSGFNEAGANLGIEGREATTGEKLSSAAGSAVSGLTFGLLGKDTASKGIASFFGAGPDAAVAPKAATVPISAAIPASLDISQAPALVKEKTPLEIENEMFAADLDKSLKEQMAAMDARIRVGTEFEDQDIALLKAEQMAGVLGGGKSFGVQDSENMVSENSQTVVDELSEMIEKEGFKYRALEGGGYELESAATGIRKYDKNANYIPPSEMAVEKTTTPNRVSQSDMLAAATEDLQMMSEKKEAPAATVVNSAPTTIINQGGGKAAPTRTPIRNPEISYNNRLTRYFVG